MTPVHRDVLVQARQHLRILEAVAPKLLQFFQEEFLRVIMLRKSARNAGDFHVVWIPVPAWSQRHSAGYPNEFSDHPAQFTVALAQRVPFATIVPMPAYRDCHALVKNCNQNGVCSRPKRAAQLAAGPLTQLSCHFPGIRDLRLPSEVNNSAPRQRSSRTSPRAGSTVLPTPD